MLDIERTTPSINELCRRLGISRLDIFGSAATDDFGGNNDVDVLVRFERDGTDLFDRYFELKEGLERLFGRDVDVVLEESIKNPYFKQGLERSRRNIYAA